MWVASYDFTCALINEESDQENVVTDLLDYKREEKRNGSDVTERIVAFPQKNRRKIYQK